MLLEALCGVNIEQDARLPIANWPPAMGCARRDVKPLTRLEHSLLAIHPRTNLPIDDSNVLLQRRMDVSGYTGRSWRDVQIGKEASAACLRRPFADDQALQWLLVDFPGSHRHTLATSEHLILRIGIPVVMNKYFIVASPIGCTLGYTAVRSSRTAKERQMSRRIELISALLASALGLIWLVYEASLLQSLWMVGAIGGSSSGQPAGQPIGFNRTGLFFVVVAAAMICIALGAYLHTIQRLFGGLLLLWVSAALATVAMAVYLIEPWVFLPIQFVYLTQAAASTWLTPMGVLSVVFAWIAAVAGIPIRRPSPPAETFTRAPLRPGPDPLTTP